MKKMNIYVNMFYKVLETFTKFFVFIYGLLIVAFALAFYILFHENNVEDDQVDNIFHSKTNVSSIFMSLIKIRTLKKQQNLGNAWLLDQNFHLWGSLQITI